MNENSAEITTPPQKKGNGGLLSFHVEHSGTHSHKLKIGVNLSESMSKPKQDPDHPNWKVIDDAMTMSNMMKAAEDADEVDDETAAANLAARESIMSRFLRDDPTLTRIDVSASLYAEIPDFDQFLDKLESNKYIEVVHLSGTGTSDTVHPEDLVATVEAIGRMPNLQELFVFRGSSNVLNEEVLAKCITAAQNLKVLMLWGYDSTLGSKENQVLAGALRMHPHIERLTITLPKQMPYAALDGYAMAFCGMPQLTCLNIRVNGPQRDPVLSPEGTTLLLSSTSIESMYLENLGLTDDHTDAIFAELKGNNQVLKTLDLKSNDFSDDAIFTLSQMLPHNNTLTSIDLSGVQITDAAGTALAESMQYNTTIQHIELEGTEQRYRDEFSIPVGHEISAWGKLLDYHIRLNRACVGMDMDTTKTKATTTTRTQFIEALNMVSDHSQCLYTIVRQLPQFCDIQPGAEERWARYVETQAAASAGVPAVVITSS
jgi:hypothetical protein